MDLNTVTELLNIPGYKVVEIISITEDEIHYCGLLNQMVKYLKCNLNTKVPISSPGIPPF